MQGHDAFCASSGRPGLSQQMLNGLKSAAIEPGLRPPVQSIGADATAVIF